MVLYAEVELGQLVSRFIMSFKIRFIGLAKGFFFLFSFLWDSRPL